MAKRTADSYITKDDDASEEEEVEEPGVREAPLAPIQGRQIRGLPKRGGATSTPAVPTPSPSGVNTPASAPKASPFSSFAFGSTAAPAAPAAAPAANTTASSTFSFGQSTSSAAPTTSPFSFGATSSNPPSTSTTPPPAPAPAKAAPFAGFSFIKPAASAPAPSNPTTTASTESNTGGKRTATEDTAPPTKKPFGGFSTQSTTTSSSGGFGSFGSESKTNSTNSFGFGQPAKPPTPTSNGFSFASKEPSSSSQTFGGSSASASTSAPTSQATSSAPPQASTNGTPASSSDPQPSRSSPPPEDEVSYYTSLRGLNTSILSFLTTTLENDSFVDLSSILPGLTEQYKKYLDEAGKSSGLKKSTPAPPAAPVATEPKKQGFSMPAPPATGSFTLPKPTSSAPPTSKGFVPSVPSTSSGSSPFSFGFGAKPAEPVKKPSADVTKLVEDVVAGREDSSEKGRDNASSAPFQPFTFGSSVATPASIAASNASNASQPAEATKPKTGGLFSFAPSGPLHPPTPDAKSFSPSTNLESPSLASTPAKLGKFGPGGSQPQLSFGGAGASPSSGGAKPVGFNFGAPGGSGSSVSGGFSIGSGPPTSGAAKAGSGFSFGQTSGSSDTAPKAAFTFGSPAAATTTSNTSSTPGGTSSGNGTDKPSTPSFTFGSPATSSFSFGGGFKPAAASTSIPSNSTAPATSTPVTFSSSFGQPADKATTEGEESTTESGEPSRNLAESIGAGEEGEETVKEQRARLLKFEGGKHITIGTGTIRVKRASGGEGTKKKRRLLMRTDGNGNIILNMGLNDKFEPSAENKTIKFLGFDLEGKPAPYVLQVKTADAASEFAQVLKKEIEALKAE